MDQGVALPMITLDLTGNPPCTFSLDVLRELDMLWPVGLTAFLLQWPAVLLLQQKKKSPTAQKSFFTTVRDVCKTVDRTPQTANKVNYYFLYYTFEYLQTFSELRKAVFYLCDVIPI